jgi:D-methionine transport system permease protein
MDWNELGPTFTLAIGQTLYMTSISLVVGGLLGLVLGVALFVTRPHNLWPHRALSAVLNVLVNVVRPIPFIIFVTAIQPVAIAVSGTSYGPNYAVVAMSLMATFGTSRIVEQNLVALDPGVVEAARAMGAGRLRTVLTVVIPEALGPLILGYTFLFVAIVDMSAVVGAIAGGGLGQFAITYGYQRYDYAVTWITVAVIVAIVQLAQLLGSTLARRVLRR